jgi:hypothetical protein
MTDMVMAWIGRSIMALGMIKYLKIMNFPSSDENAMVTKEKNRIRFRFLRPFNSKIYDRYSAIRSNKRLRLPKRKLLIISFMKDFSYFFKRYK